jgi:methylmalonyl-CoA mutase C-terminal domain/subunit
MVRNKPIKVIMAKTALDGHWRGVQVVASAMRDAGMEVVYAGMVTAESVFRVAVQEDADVIGLNVGASYEQVRELMRMLKENHIDQMLVIVGGTVPHTDIPELKQMGVGEVFPPGSKLSDIVKFVQENAKGPLEVSKQA